VFVYQCSEWSGGNEWGVSDDGVGMVFCWLLVGGRRVGLLVCGDGGWGSDVVLFVVGIVTNILLLQE
jgi:hypothetical protein